METWVLIIVLLAYDGTAIATQEFTSKEKCLRAGNAIQTAPYTSRILNLKTICSPK